MVNGIVMLIQLGCVVANVPGVLDGRVGSSLVCGFCVGLLFVNIGNRVSDKLTERRIRKWQKKVTQ